MRWMTSCPFTMSSQTYRWVISLTLVVMWLCTGLLIVHAF